MSPWRLAAMAAAVVLAATGTAPAQQQFIPRIGYVYPAGGRQGATFQVTVGGQYVRGVTNAYVSGTGVQAKVIEHIQPLTQKQFNDLRERLQELMKKPKDANALKEMAEIRSKLTTFRRNLNPAIAETVTVEIAAAGDAACGRRELRLGTPAGLTNPLVFCIGQLPEVCQKPATAPPNPAALGAFRLGGQPPPGAAQAATSITLPTVVNGQIMPGEVDRYRFQARKGQRLVLAASARELIPYLPDAVPGWFQAVLALYDASGNEVAYSDDYRFHPDPVICYEVPKDGEYLAEIRDAIYRGREDFVYRIAVGELPFVTSIFPLGGRAGTQTAVELTGWNLPAATLVQDATDKAQGAYPISVRSGELLSNSEPFAVDTLPECLEKEANDEPAGAQTLSLPIIVNGRIGRPGDWDVFRVEARAGDQIVAEVCARRLDSPLDSVLRLTDSSGRQLAFNDDHEDKGAGLTTHHADSWLAATVPADGTYYLHLGDVQHKGGPEYGYRLRISPPQPDFALRVVPSGISARAGATVPLAVYALRKDGFAGEITLALRDMPLGFTLAGARVPAGQDQVRITLTLPATAPKEPVSLHLEGRAMIQGQQVTRPAVPAEDMMQAFAYRHLVPAQELKVAISGRFAQRNPVRILTATPIRIPAGGTARVQVGVPANTLLGKVELELSEPPDGIAIQSISPGPLTTTIVVKSDAAKVKPGLKGNLIVSVFATRAPAAASQKAKAVPRRQAVGALPAIPFEVVAP